MKTINIFCQLYGENTWSFIKSNMEEIPTLLARRLCPILNVPQQDYDYEVLKMNENNQIMDC